MLILKVNLLDSVTKRFYHSMSAYYISKQRFWIVVTGGCSEYNPSNGTLKPITGSDTISIIELGMITKLYTYHVI